jgi:ABC-type transport system involved in multi-copper enzyme maturation permease subunit
VRNTPDCDQAKPAATRFLFAQPVGRTTLLIGHWIGELAALGGAVVLGFGIGGAAVAMSAGWGG